MDVINMDKINELRLGLETAYIDGSVASDSFYCPQFVSNNYKSGKKVLSSIEDELLRCDKFQISVAFITMSGITPLLQTFKDLEKKNIPGEILTTNYLNFSEPKALEKLNGLSNITLKMYDVQEADEGFHTKGYIFKTDEVYRIIIGSSNITSAALTSNHEWNTKLVSTQQGKIAKEIVEEFNRLWNSSYALDFNEFYGNYKEQYEIIKHQRDIARIDNVVSLEKYKLKPNSMQIGFITNLKKILEEGEDRALLISATGTGKTYASAFAMRELGFKKVLFLVHRGQLARQTKKSYEKVFAKSVSMGLVGAGYHEYEADYVFATVQTLNRDEHLLQYDKNAFDCIIFDEAHHVTADTYQKIMKHFTPKLWLGMTATPDKRDDNIAGRNVYELFNYKIAYEIRLQQAMEENLLCPFHYFGIMEGGRVIPGASTVHFDEISKKRIFASVDNANFSDIKLIKENYTNLKNKLGRIPHLRDFDDYGEMDVARIFDNNSLGSYYKFLVKYEKDYKLRLSQEEEKIVEFISKKLANGKRIQELQLLKRMLMYAKGLSKCGLFSSLSQDMLTYGKSISKEQKENIINVMTNEFPAGSGKKTYAQCVFIEKEGNDYKPTKTFLEMLLNKDFYNVIKELVDFGISRYERDYKQSYDVTDFVLYQKYTYEDVCRLLNWEQNEVPLNIGGYKYDKKTKTFPVFINYDKSDDISDTTKYEDHFESGFRDRLIAISKSGRSLQSEDVQNFLKAKERGIRVELFVRKNKDDKISKEFYYLGHMTASGNTKEFTMPNTQKTAVEIEWILDVPVREDIYEYIVNS